MKWRGGIGMQVKSIILGHPLGEDAESKIKLYK